uniref:EGF-like domain-containing protein n=1 Tax=Cyprinodon variegatus TaxID=28743 RepID=A0A3Q2DQZ9_CYPVA
MVSSRRYALLLLVSFILQWTSAWSHLHTNPSILRRVRKEIPFEGREKTEKTLTLGKEILSLVKDTVETLKANDIKDIVKSLSVFAGIAPGIGTVASSLINMVLIFIPQNDPVLDAVNKGFAEVNQKLDSLSIQISNLQTDVEWFNFASAYSRDEVTILSAWRKYIELHQSSQSLQSLEDRRRLSEIFKNFYETSGAESSVSNFYQYLTVEGVAIHQNLNRLLRDKFKCDIKIISSYNFYLSSLLWKGMVLNQMYWKLIGLHTSTKEDQHVQMFNKVFEAQLAGIDYCKQNYESYMKLDVLEAAKSLSPDNKMAIAVKVKEVLDNKYNWYKWGVVVYNKAEKHNHRVIEATEIDAGEVIVLVRFIRHTDVTFYQDRAKRTAELCFRRKYCSEITEVVQKCKDNTYPASGLEDNFFYLKQHATETHAFYSEDFAEVPEPLHQVDCYWTYSSLGKVSLHYSVEMPVCSNVQCQNSGTCERVLLSNQWFCRCSTGYYGEYCEQQFDTSRIPGRENPDPPADQ